MFFKYPLTNDDAGPHMESDINIKDVNIKIINELLLISQILNNDIKLT